MNFTIAQKLQDMKNAGGAWQRHHQADQILIDLRDLLSENEYSEIQIALGHYRSGEGTGELYTVCNRFINKYRGQQPPRSSRICA